MIASTFDKIWINTAFSLIHMEVGIHSFIRLPTSERSPLIRYIYRLVFTLNFLKSQILILIILKFEADRLT